MDATNPLQNFLFIDNYLKLNSALVIAQDIPSRNRILSVYAPLSNADTYVLDPTSTIPTIGTMTVKQLEDILYSASGYFERTQFVSDPDNPNDKDAAMAYWTKLGAALVGYLYTTNYSSMLPDTYWPFYKDTATNQVYCLHVTTTVSLKILESTDETQYKMMIPFDLPLEAEMQDNVDLKTKLTNWYTQIYNDQSAAGVAAANALPPGNPKLWITEKVTSFYDDQNLTGLFYSDSLNTGWTLNEQSYHLDIRLWDVSNVKSMELAFADSNYNKPLSSWERVLPNKSTLANCTNFSKMFINSAFDQYIINWAIKASSTGKLLNGDDINVGDDSALGPNMNQMVRESGLYNTDSFNQGFKEVNKDTEYPGTPPYSLFGQAICFNKGTQILCFKDNKEMYIPVEDLRKGDLVKTLHHGYQAIHKITTGFFTLGRPIDMGMYKMKKQGTMIADLEMSGLHSMLVDEHDPEYADDVKRQYTTQPRRKIYLHEHFRLQANYSSKFEKMPTKGYQIYSFALEGDEIQYPIWANGLLVETTSKQYVASGAMVEVKDNCETNYQ